MKRVKRGSQSTCVAPSLRVFQYSLCYFPWVTFNLLRPFAGCLTLREAYEGTGVCAAEAWNSRPPRENTHTHKQTLGPKVGHLMGQQDTNHQSPPETPHNVQRSINPETQIGLGGPENCKKVFCERQSTAKGGENESGGEGGRGRVRETVHKELVFYGYAPRWQCVGGTRRMRAIFFFFREATDTPRK